jgi:2-C-methyl-D-erythritol 4-phosphate cytidylyltransferase
VPVSKRANFCKNNAVFTLTNGWNASTPSMKRMVFVHTLKILAEKKTLQSLIIEVSAFHTEISSVTTVWQGNFHRRKKTLFIL